MLKIGLTGSIATGKSFVTSVFAAAGCHVIDADDTAREVVRPGTIGFEQIVQYFGSSVIGPDGTLDRPKLAGIIFNDHEKRKVLNGIVHPLVLLSHHEQLKEFAASDPESILIIDASLMIESGSFREFDKLIVVHCRPDVQRARLMARDKVTAEEAEARISSQMQQQEKMGYADFLIDTSEGFEDTFRQTREVLRRLQTR